MDTLRSSRSTLQFLDVRWPFDGHGVTGTRFDMVNLATFLYQGGLSEANALLSAIRIPAVKEARFCLHVHDPDSSDLRSSANLLRQLRECEP